MGDFTVNAIPDPFSEVQDDVDGPANLETTNIPSQPALLQPTAYRTIELDDQRSAELEVNSQDHQQDEICDKFLDIKVADPQKVGEGIRSREVQDDVDGGPANLETTDIPSQPALLQPTAYRTIELDDQRSAELEVNSHSSQDSDEDSDSSTDDEELLTDYGLKVLKKMPRLLTEHMLQLMYRNVFLRKNGFPLEACWDALMVLFTAIDTSAPWTKIEVMECYHLMCLVMDQPLFNKGKLIKWLAASTNQGQQVRNPIDEARDVANSLELLKRQEQARQEAAEFAAQFRRNDLVPAHAAITNYSSYP